MLSAVIDFFKFITEPIFTFCGQIVTNFTSVATYLLNFLISFWQGFVDFLQAITQVINGS